MRTTSRPSADVGPVAPELGGSYVIEEAVLLSVWSGVQALQAQVVATSLEDRECWRNRQGRCERLGKPRQVAFDKLPLQRDRGSRDDDRSARRRQVIGCNAARGGGAPV